MDENCHKKKFIKRALEIRIKIVSTDTFNFNYKSNIQADQKKKLMLFKLPFYWAYIID